jgi:hypothetical protein
LISILFILCVPRALEPTARLRPRERSSIDKKDSKSAKRSRAERDFGAPPNAAANPSELPYRTAIARTVKIAMEACAVGALSYRTLSWLLQLLELPEKSGRYLAPPV